MTAAEVTTAVVLLGLMATLVREWAAPAAAVMVAAIVLLLLGVIDAEQAFSGFSSSAVITVAALFVVAGAVERTGLLSDVVAGVVSPSRPRLWRLLVPVAGCSAVMNNTPIVAAMAPPVLRACQRAHVPASRFLMPLSYATILGGVVTTIGTSTNLVVSGLLAERDMAPFGLLEMAPVGLPVAVGGLVLLLATSRHLLPDRASPSAQVLADPRRYALDLEVVAGGPLDGSAVADSHLRGLTHAYLAARHTDGHLRPVNPTTRLRGGDVLRFVGDVGQAATALVGPGLRPHTPEHAVSQEGAAELEAADPDLVEAVLDAGSTMVGRTLREVGFRERFGAVVLAIHRGGEPMEAKLGTVTLRAGDALLLLCDPARAGELGARGDFGVVAPLAERARARRTTVPTVLIALAMVVVTATGAVEVLQAATAAVLALLALRCISTAEARAAIDLDVLVIIAGSFALGAAMEASGLAARVAAVASSAGDVGGRAAAVAVVVALTMVLTEPLSNAAAAALMVPVALDVAGRLGGDPRVFAVAVAVAASASFLTPIGYQTNVMVYGLGGYRFTDYARLGAPLSLLCWALASAMVLLLAW